MWKYSNVIVMVFFNSVLTSEGMSGSGYNIIETIVIPDDVDGVRSEGSGIGCDVIFSHSITDAACNGGTTITTEEKLYTSGGICTKYRDLETCDWTIHVPNDSVGIMFIVNYFEVEDDYDCVFDITVDDTEVLVMCGNGHQGKQFEYRGSVFRVTFTSDYNKRRQGFNITTKFISNPTTTASTQTTTMMNLVLATITTVPTTSTTPAATTELRETRSEPATAPTGVMTSTKESTTSTEEPTTTPKTTTQPMETTTAELVTTTTELVTTTTQSTTSAATTAVTMEMASTMEPPGEAQWCIIIFPIQLPKQDNGSCLSDR